HVMERGSRIAETFHLLLDGSELGLFALRVLLGLGEGSDIGVEFFLVEGAIPLRKVLTGVASGEIREAAILLEIRRADGPAGSAAGQRACGDIAELRDGRRPCVLEI